MEVVCLILGPMSASQPCSHPFWVLTSLHLLSFLLKMFFIIYIYEQYNYSKVHKPAVHEQQGFVQEFCFCEGGGFYGCGGVKPRGVWGQLGALRWVSGS